MELPSSGRVTEGEWIRCWQTQRIVQIALEVQSDLLGSLAKDWISDLEGRLEAWLRIADAKRHAVGLTSAELPLVEAARRVTTQIASIRRGRDQMAMFLAQQSESMDKLKEMLPTDAVAFIGGINAPLAGLTNEAKSNLPDPDESAATMLALQHYLDVLSTFGPLSQYSPQPKE